MNSKGIAGLSLSEFMLFKLEVGHAIRCSRPWTFTRSLGLGWAADALSKSGPRLLTRSLGLWLLELTRGLSRIGPLNNSQLLCQSGKSEKSCRKSSHCRYFSPCGTNICISNYHLLGISQDAASRSTYTSLTTDTQTTHLVLQSHPNIQNLPSFESKMHPTKASGHYSRGNQCSLDRRE